METDSPTGSTNLASTILSSVERLLRGWGNTAVILPVLVLPPLWLVNTYFPQGAPFATISFITIIFATGIINIRQGENYLQAQEKGEEIVEKYPLTLVISVFLVTAVTSMSTIILIGAFVGTYVDRFFGPSYAVMAAVFVPAVDNELSTIHTFLSPSNIVKYMTLQIIVSLSYLRGRDVDLLMDVFDPRYYRGFSP